MCLPFTTSVGRQQSSYSISGKKKEIYAMEMGLLEYYIVTECKVIPLCTIRA